MIIKKKILISASIMIAGFVFWFVANIVLHVAAVGRELTYVFSPHYSLSRGLLMYHPEPDNLHNVEFPVSEGVWVFCVTSPWLFGKTEKGYLAINMDLHETHYPVDTVEALTDKTGVQVLPEDWLDNKKEQTESGYLYRWPKAVKFRKCFNIIFWVVYACTGIGLIIWITKKPKAKRVQPTACSEDE